MAADDPLLSVYDDGDMVFQWHMDTFDLPAGATLLATGDDVTNQALRLNDVTWATQFHFEIDVPHVDQHLPRVLEIHRDARPDDRLNLPFPPRRASRVAHPVAWLEHLPHTRRTYWLRQRVVGHRDILFVVIKR